MSIYEPKIIKLSNSVVVTGNKTLIFLSDEEFKNKKIQVLEQVKNSFNSIDDNGLQFRADKETLSVTIIPTTDCNLRCVYCYADGGCEKLYLNFEDVKKFIDQLHTFYSDCNKINVYFAGGGEPLLNFNLIKETIDYIHSVNLKPSIRIVTNGILVKKYFDWLKKNNVNLRISYDGYSQNKTRPGLDFDSSKILCETLIFLKNNYPLDLLSVQMTITNLNVNHMSEDVEKIMLEYGVDTIKLEPVHSSFSERSKNISSPKIEDYVFNFLKTIDSLVQKNINGYLDISCLTIPSTSYFCSIRNKTIVSPYKIMAPCVEIIKPGTKDDLILNYDLDNIDFNNIRKIQEEKLFNLHPKNYNICSNCNFVHFCKSNCPMRTILSNSKPNIYNCMLSKKLLPEFLERANKNDKYMAIVFGNDYKKEEVCD
jgi:uncharacterized protein